MLKPDISQPREELSLMSNSEIAQAAESHLHQIKKVRRENQKIQEELGKRSIKEIISSGETFYMGACVDMTLSFLMKLKEKIPLEKIELSCELLRQTKTGNLTFHLFLQDYSENPVRIIDFEGSNRVKIYQWAYQNPQAWTNYSQLGMFSMNCAHISEGDSFLSLSEKMNIHLPPELFQAHIQKLQADNTEENFLNFQQSAPIEIKIQEHKEKISENLSELLWEKTD